MTPHGQASDTLRTGSDTPRTGIAPILNPRGAVHQHATFLSRQRATGRCHGSETLSQSRKVVRHPNRHREY